MLEVFRIQGSGLHPVLLAPGSSIISGYAEDDPPPGSR